MKTVSKKAHEMFIRIFFMQLVLQKDIWITGAGTGLVFEALK